MTPAGPRSRLVLLLALATGCTAADSDPNAAARRLVAEALAVHGSSEQLRAAGGFTLDLRGERVMIDQSRRADPPWDRQPSTVRIAFDPAQSRWSWQTISAYPGLGPFGSRRVVGPGAAFELDPVGDGHGPEIIPLTPEDSVAMRRELARFLPTLLLETIAEQPGLERLAPVRTESGMVERIAFVDHEDRRRILLLGSDQVVLGSVGQRPDPVYGTVTDSVRYEEADRRNGVLVPRRMTELQNGAVARTLAYAFAGGPPADSVFAVPPGHFFPEPGADAHHMAPMSAEPLQPIGEGLYLDGRVGVVVADLGGGVAVFDCPNDAETSEATISAIRSTLGKPVRYLVASHTHPDHCGGAQPYLDGGTTVVVAADHEGFFRRLATKPARIEALRPGERRDLAGVAGGVTVLNVGPSPHSEETLIAVLAGDLLWQVDLFLGQMTGPLVAGRPTSDWLAREIERRSLDFRRIIDPHTGAVFSRAQFNEALQRAGFRPVGAGSARGLDPVKRSAP
ncbi:MAG: MBL fold metallo-hydrolase [Gemmatimonadales bacterium]